MNDLRFAFRHLLKNTRFAAQAALLAALATGLSAAPATGPLRVSKENPRYFTDGSGAAIYLTGSHTWNSLQDMGYSDPPSAFDFKAYLDFLEKHHHNFIRLWRWELPQWIERSSSQVRYCAPQPWKRAGPGNALDGKPKSDLDGPIREILVMGTRTGRCGSRAAEHGRHAPLRTANGPHRHGAAP